MKINSLFEKKTVYSFEVFPPKKTSSVETVYKALEEIKSLQPDFISVTLGAGGTGNGDYTLDVAKKIHEGYGITPMAHLPCIHCTKERVDELLKQFEDSGVENILALRGDKIEGVEPEKDFEHANDLISYIKEKTGDKFDIAGACYPECHQEASSMDEDIKNLKRKVDAGATHLISQLFFDNEAYFDFLYRARMAGITVPIEAGIMPVTNRAQIERMVCMCGSSLPRKFTRIMQRYEDNKEALRDAGIAYAVDQIIDLIAAGVDGIHLYTMNNPYVARKITEAVSEILKAQNEKR